MARHFNTSNNMIDDTQKIFWLFSTLLFGWLLYLLAPVLTPFVCAALLAYLGDPIVDRLEAKKLSRTLGVTIVFFVMLTFVIILLFIIVPLLEQQLVRLIKRLPDAIGWLETSLLPYISSTFGLDENQLSLEQLRQNITQHWRDVSGIMSKLIAKLSQSGQTLLAICANIVLIPVVTFYLLRDWDIFVARIHELIPRTAEPVVSKLAKECDEVLGEFLHGQLLLMLAQGVFYSIGLWIVGLEFSLLIGMLAGLVSFVPYLGVIVGIVVAGIAALLQFHDVIHIVYILIVFGIGQALEGMLLSPLLVGDRIGLHPIAVIFAVMAGGQLFGFIGVLLALPLAAIIVIILRLAHERYLESTLYSE